jgi:hypothetical protein
MSLQRYVLPHNYGILLGSIIIQMLTNLTIPIGLPHQRNLKFEIQKGQSQLLIGIKVPPQQICLLHELHDYEF